MAKRNQTQQEVQDEADELKSRLAETEETLRAIQEYGDTWVRTVRTASRW
jgi:hypothetical protein